MHDPKDGGGRVKQEPEPRKHKCRGRMDAQVSDADVVLERQHYEFKYDFGAEKRT